MKKVFVTLMCLTPLSGSAKWFNFEEHSVKFKAPSSWRVEVGKAGIPFFLMSPLKMGKNGEKKGRITLSIVPTSSDPKKYSKYFTPGVIEADYENYKSDKKKWISKYSGKIHSFHPYKKTNWKNTKEVHNVGFDYNFGGVEFVQTTTFAFCKNEIYHIKALYRKNEYPNAPKLLKNIYNSFDCKAVRR